MARISSSTPAATCSRRRTSRCSRSTSWTRLGVTYQVLGGPTPLLRRRADAHRRRRHVRPLRREHHGQARPQQVRARWCPGVRAATCSSPRRRLPTVEKTRGAKPFEMTPFMLFLRRHLDRLRPFLTQARRRCASRCTAIPASRAWSRRPRTSCSAVPGIELVDLKQPAVGMMSNYFRALPAYRRELQKNELDAAETAGVDALVAVYHADHRELCAHERDYPFRIMNLLEIVGDSMGLHHDDHFKRLKMLQDVDAIAGRLPGSGRAARARCRPPRGSRSRPCSTSSRCRCAARSASGCRRMGRISRPASKLACVKVRLATVAAIDFFDRHGRPARRCRSSADTHPFSLGARARRDARVHCRGAVLPGAEPGAALREPPPWPRAGLDPLAALPPVGTREAACDFPGHASSQSTTPSLGCVERRLSRYSPRSRRSTSNSCPASMPSCCRISARQYDLAFRGNRGFHDM